MSRVFWDTNLFIYLAEDTGVLGERVARLRVRMLDRGDELLTSTLTLGEVLVKPTAAGDELLRRRYEATLSEHVNLIPFNEAAARAYASIRARERSIRPPDAMQLACASQARVDLFITNDDRLSAKVIPGIQFVTSLERAFV